MKDTGGEFTRVVNVERVGRDPITFDVQATSEECRILADRLDILDLQGVTARGSLSRDEATSQIALTAALSATATQACVVTLDPVEQKIDVEFTVFYTFDASDLVDEEVEKVVGLDEPDPPTLIVGHRIDLVDAIAEQILLALDPYPRRSDLPETDGGDGEESVSDEMSQEVHRPFANLKDLMNKK
ncbi:DUF177 domain-containing protein [Sneathiella sp.]|uniref:DUF177 domain-containing protein n=1 Tax=Sneathiella sp. TaxID=1964365 RepID=UPI0035661E8F